MPAIALAGCASMEPPPVPPPPQAATFPLPPFPAPPAERPAPPSRQGAVDLVVVDKSARTLTVMAGGRV